MKFPGFGDSAPLDVSDVSAAALGTRLRDGTFNAWAESAAAVRYCARPVRLVGSSETFDATTGEHISSFSSADAPLGLLYRPCGNRRADICPACSRTYAKDTFVMLRAGLAGGKTVPEAVADNPLLFATFTAPSFGHVHSALGKRCRPRDSADPCRHGRPTGCMTDHWVTNPEVGAPICDDCYDWNSAAIWQWWAPELWRRTTIAMRRAVAAELGVKESELRSVASVQFARVAEFQVRGLVHFHALIRIDGPDGPGSPAPLDGKALARSVAKASRAVEFLAPPVDAEDVSRRLAWGRQLDVRVVRDGTRTDDPSGPLTPEQVAGYLAKYATKDATSIRDEVRPHLKRLEQTCHQLASRAIAANPGSPYALLGKWTHMLGFRGHFSSKSRRYSVTLGRLRRARHRYRTLMARAERTGTPLDVANLEAELLSDDETTLVVGSWFYQGTGWTSPGDEALALAAAARARDYEQWRAKQKPTKRSEAWEGETKMEKLLLSMDEAAEVLGVGRSTVYDLVRMQVLQSVKIGSRRMVPVTACHELIAQLLEGGAVA